MNGKRWLAAGCLLAGIVLAAYGLSTGAALLALIGLALVFAFWFFAWQWIASANKPSAVITPAANAAWSLRAQPPGPGTGSASPSSGKAGEANDDAARQGDQ